MLEKLVMLDEKGLVCPDTLSAEQHLHYSRLALDYSRNFELGGDVRRLLYEKGVCRVKRRIKMPARAVKKVKRLFHTDVSWIVTMRMGISSFFGAGGAISYGHPPALVPVILCSLPIKNIYVHEAVHAFRFFSRSSQGYDGCFEEAFAECATLAPWHDFCDIEQMWRHISVIKKTARKLEDYLEKSSLYALSRLTMNEVYAVKESPFPLDALKSFGMIRHQVMRARLGI